MSRLVPALTLTAVLAFSGMQLARGTPAKDQVKTENGTVEGVSNADQTVRMFKGIPFAAPPVGELRWRAPQSAANWTGVRMADKFGSACLQTNVFGDIYFRDNQPSEDCLNLSIWIPAKAASGKLPVIVWFYGGGFVAGSNSEPRYDGENLAKKGVIIVSPNYRLGAFGFFAHAELTKESEHHASGNYGLLDQVAALRWVNRNIAAFGGDPENITIAGESAGSFSVCAQMATPLSKGLFQKAIGESGGYSANRRDKPLADAEKAGAKFAESLNATTIAQMRAKPAEEILQAAAKLNRGFDFGPIQDGYFFPADTVTIYAKGEQAQVPLLAGWNADEGKMMVLFSPQKPTAKSFSEMAHTRFGERAEQFLKVYPAGTDEEALQSAYALANDDFIVYSTWKWLDTQAKRGKVPVYRYLFEQVPATKPGAMIGPIPATLVGSRHAGEIEYVFQTLKSQEGVPWTEDDFKVSDTMSSYWANFAKNGDPNGAGLPQWPKYDKSTQFSVQHLIGNTTHAAPEAHRDRYEFLDAQAALTAGAAPAGTK